MAFWVLHSRERSQRHALRRPYRRSRAPHLGTPNQAKARLHLKVQLVWIEQHPTRDSAKTREFRLKKWNRLWKLDLIEDQNPDWQDLYLDLNNWYSPHGR